MPSYSHLHARISRRSTFMYRVAGLAFLLLTYMMAQEPRSVEPYVRLMEQSLLVFTSGMAAYGFVKPLLVYEIHIDPDTITLSRMAGRLKVVIARKNIVSYHYENSWPWYANVPTHSLTLYTSDARYELDASDYLNFEEIKHEITKGVKPKF